MTWPFGRKHTQDTRPKRCEWFKLLRKSVLVSDWWNMMFWMLSKELIEGFFFKISRLEGDSKRIKMDTFSTPGGFDYPISLCCDFLLTFQKKSFRRSKLRSFCSGCFSHSLSTSSTKSSLWHPVRPGKGFGVLYGGCDGCGPFDLSSWFSTIKILLKHFRLDFGRVWSLMAFWY